MLDPWFSLSSLEIIENNEESWLDWDWEISADAEGLWWAGSVLVLLADEVASGFEIGEEYADAKYGLEGFL